MKSNHKKRVFRSILIILVVIGISVTGLSIYASDYYRADTAAIESFSCSTDVTKTMLSDGVTAYSSGHPKTGFIFYPGGKVEHTAYEPLLKACAENNILCILIQMPFHLAVLDINAADGIKEQFPDIENWYIGGHSLGGSMAASYVSKNVNQFDGLILLASYSTVDLSKTDLNILCVYGSEDKVLNHKKYEKYRTNLSDAVEEVVLDGGCHAYFGMYGEQDGDGTPTLKNEEQITLTANKIIEFAR